MQPGILPRVTYRTLGRDRIDILMIHEPDRPGQYDRWTDIEEPRGPALELLEELKREGIIRFTGIGGTTSHELAMLVGSGKFDVVLTAYNYSLLWREAALEIIPAARQQNVGVILGSPLQQQALSRRYDGEVERDVAAAAKGQLPSEALTRLDAIASMVPFRPFEEPAGLGWLLASGGSHKGPGPAR